MYKIELLSEAEDELSEAYKWYEDRQIFLGDKLYWEVRHLLGLIEINPYQYQVKYNNDLRSAPISRFPYLILYWIDEKTKTVYVNSIFHTSKKPKYL